MRLFSQRNTKRRKKTREFSKLLPSKILWLLLIILYLLVATSKYPISALQMAETKQNLERVKALLNQIIEGNENLPTDLSSLRLREKIKGKNAPLYDAYGEQWSYEKITSQIYSIKTFSQTKDHLSFFSDQTAYPPKYSGKGRTLLHNLDGMKGTLSNDGKKYAALYFNRDSYSQKLVVFDRKQKNTFETASKKYITQYSWLESQANKLLFITGPFQFEQAGIYTWNLSNQKLKKIHPKPKLHSPSQKKDNSKISLYLIINHRPLELLIVEDNQRLYELFSGAPLNAYIKIRSNNGSFVSSEKEPPVYWKDLFQSMTENCQAFSKDYAAICDSERNQENIGAKLEFWQNLVIKAAYTPGWSLLLVGLITQYVDLIETLEANTSSDQDYETAKALITLGEELSHTLKNHPTSLKWQIAFANHVETKLRNQKEFYQPSESQ